MTILLYALLVVTLVCVITLAVITKSYQKVLHQFHELKEQKEDKKKFTR